MERKTIALVLAAKILTGCGGGSTSSATPASSGNICSVQTEYFANVAGSRSGQVREAVVASVAADSYCEFDVDLYVNNDPDPSRNCEMTGSVSYIGTQLVVNPVSAIECHRANNLPVRLGQSVSLVATNPNTISPPLSVLLFVESPDLDGNTIRVPFNSRQVLTLNSDYSIQIDEQTIVKEGVDQ